MPYDTLIENVQTDKTEATRQDPIARSPLCDHPTRFPNSKLYPGIAATLATMAELYERGRRSTDFASFIAQLRQDYGRHHRGLITITGPADHLVVTDQAGSPLSAESFARPPTRPPPTVAPCRGPTGERADWWWYEPFQPQPPPTNN